jgi:histidinol dehydrogenase
MLKIVDSSNESAVERLLAPRRPRDRAVAARAISIVNAVRRRGDTALRTHARKLDGLEGPVEVAAADIIAGAAQVDPVVRLAIRDAARHIRRVARQQVPRSWRVTVAPGVVVEQRVTPLARVGCYVPAGRHPLPSSLLMTAIPARVAGVREVVAVSPRPDPVVYAAALEAGVTRFFRIGGAQAIGALAFGTASVPRVDKIVGPGNAYVAAAKNYVSSECGIDFQAGPSEILIVARRGRADWIAADLLAQAEHDPDARALLVTPSRRLAEQVAREVSKRLPTTGPARAALSRNGGAIVTRTLDEAVDVANRMAPEHLVCFEASVARRIVSAGTTFVGPLTAQAAGDYATGSNHVLPTGGAARLRGGLSAADFVHVSTHQRLTKAGLERLAPTVTALAEAEGLTAHAESIRVRLR